MSQQSVNRQNLKLLRGIYTVLEEHEAAIELLKIKMTDLKTDLNEAFPEVRW